MPDVHANFAYATVATAPSPATTGTSLVVAAGLGALFPTVPFNATVWPTGAQPLSTTAEIVRVTARSTDTLTIMRAQESSTARTVIVGDQIAATVTARTLTDVEAGSSPDLAISLRKAPRENVIPSDAYALVGTDYETGAGYGIIGFFTSSSAATANAVFATKVTLPTHLLPTAIYVRSPGNGTFGGTGGNMKAAVYSDSGGLPASLIYSIAAQAFLSTDTTVRFAAPATEIGGTVWVAALTDADASVGSSNRAAEAALQVSRSAGVSYAGGFPDPFGVPGVTSQPGLGFYPVAENATEIGQDSILEVAL